MEVAWRKVGAIQRMLEDFPLLLLHDNVRPHTANKTNETLRNFKISGCLSWLGWFLFWPSFVACVLLKWLPNWCLFWLRFLSAGVPLFVPCP
jgi:hypothetical protein